MYWTSTDELMMSPTCTEHPRCTHNIPRRTEHSPIYSWYPPNVLMVSPDVLMVSPRCTDYTLYRVNLIFYHSKILWNLGYQNFIYCILCQRHFHARSTFCQGRLIQVKNGKDKYKEFLYVQPYWLMHEYIDKRTTVNWLQCGAIVKLSFMQNTISEILID